MNTFLAIEACLEKRELLLFNRNKKSLRRGWAPPEAHYTLQPTPAKHRRPDLVKTRVGCKSNHHLGSL